MPEDGLRLTAIYWKYRPHGKKIGSTPWNCVDSQQEYERHMRFAELTKQWHVPVEAPPATAIKGAGWMYYDPALYWEI